MPQDNVLPFPGPPDLSGDRNQPIQTALQAMDADADEAAESEKIGNALDVPGSTVNIDPEGYKRQLRARLVSDFLENNEHLRDYVRAHSFGAKISADDWGPLDKLSESMRAFSAGQTQLGKAINIAEEILPGAFKGMAGKMAEQTIGPKSIAGATAGGFAEGFGVPEFLKPEELPQPGTWQSRHPEVYSAIRQLLISSGIDPAIELPQRLFSGALGALHAGVKATAIRAGKSESDAESLANEAAAMGEFAPFHTTGIPEVGLPPIPKPRIEPTLPGLTIPRKPVPGEPGAPSIPPVVTEAMRTLPWAQAGQPPPIRVGPLVIEGAKADIKDGMKAYDEVFADTEKTATKPRSPESMRKFVQVGYGDSTIGISAEKAKELYGDGKPTVGDNKLGWIPNIEEQYESAITTGRDITVPHKDFLANVSKETWDVIHDGIRLNHDGLTLDEAKEIKPPPEPKPTEEATPEKPEPPTPHETLARAAGLRPDYSDGWEIAEPGEEPKMIHLELPEGTGPAEMRGIDRDTGEVTKGQSTYTFKGKDILDQLNFEDLPADARTLSQFWQRTLKQLAGDTKIHVAPYSELKKVFPELEPSNGGLHWPGTGDVYIPEETFIHQPEQMVNLVILHELAHSVTTDAIDRFPEIKKSISRLMDEVAAWHETEGTTDFQPGGGYQGSGRPYAFINEKEFIAEGISNPEFRRRLQETPLSDEMADRLGLPHKPGNTFWDAVRGIIKELWASLTGKAPEPAVMDAFFRMMDAIEQANKILEEAGGVERPALSAVSFADIPPEQLAKSPFAKAAFDALTQKRLEAYLKLLKEQQDRSTKETREAKQMEEAKKATKEWKDNYPRIREDVRDEIHRRPDIAADRFLRTQKMPNGQKAPGLKIDPNTVDPEFRRELPDDYFGEGGIHPDDLSRAFGYQSGDQMLRDLVRLEQDREMADLTPVTYLRGIIDQEAERRMQRDYGVSAQDIIDRAERHIVNPNAQDILIAELQALNPDEKTPITRRAFEAHAKFLFDRLPQDTHNFQNYVNAMGREGQKAEDAMIEGDWQTAFEAKQRQAMIAFHAKFTKDLEKTRKQMVDLADKYQNRLPTKTVDPLHVNAIQTLLMKVTEPGFVRRTAEDLANQWNALSKTDLRGWVAKENRMPELNPDPNEQPLSQVMRVEDWLLDPDFHGDWKEMEPPALRALVGSLRSIEKHGRDEQTLLVRGEREERRRVIDGLVDRLRAAVGGEKTDPNRTSALRAIGSLLLTTETWMRRLDLGNPQGPFTQLIARPIQEGQYDRALMEREFSKKWKEIGNFGNTRKKIENSLFMDPLTKFQTPLEMTEGHLWAVLANMGNEGNRRVLAAGYGIDDPARIWPWLQQHGVTEKEVARAQKMGDFFSELYGRSEDMYHELAGWAGERIPLYSVNTPWGPINEWYHPLIPDPIRHGTTKPEDMMPGNGFTQIRPSATYTKARTGATYPVQLNFDAIPLRIKQIINDTAMRPAVTEVSKIILDNDFRNNFNLYYGKEYGQQLREWLKDSAGIGEYTSSKEAGILSFLNFVRQNMITALIGWNPGTWAKHGTTAAFWSAMEVDKEDIPAFVANLGISNWSRKEEAMNKSAELQTRRRQVREGIYAANEDLFHSLDYTHPYWQAREWTAALGALPIATTDLVFSRALWLTKYDKAIKNGLSEGDAIYDADTAVRRTHGSSLLASRPAIMRAHPAIQALLPFYTFFNNALNRNYEAAWKAKMALQGRTLSDMTGFEKQTFDRGFKNLAPAMGGLFFYAVIPSLIEQLIDPLPTTEDEDPIKYGAKVLFRAPLAMIPGVREIASYALEGHDPSAGIYGSALRTFPPVIRDISKRITDEDYDPDPARTIRSWNALIAAGTGLSMISPPRTGTFIYNYLTDQEDPEGLREWWRGILKGKSQEKQR